MFEIRACIAFKNRNRIGYLVGLTQIIGNDRIQHHRIGRCVFTFFDWRRQSTHAIFARIQIRFEIPTRIRIAIRHHHAAQIALVHHFARRAFVIVSDGTQLQAHARIQTHVKFPIAPFHLAAIDAVVFAFRLRNHQRFYLHPFAIGTIIRSRRHRHRYHTLVFDFNHFFGIQIHHRYQVFNRMRPVIAIANVQIRHHFQHAQIVFQIVFIAKIAHGQRRGHHFFDIVNTAFFQGCGVFWAGFNRLLHSSEIVEQHHAMFALLCIPFHHFTCCQIHFTFDDAVFV